MSYPHGVAPPPYSAVPNITAQLSNMSVSSAQHNLLVNGAIVHLWSKKSGLTLRISDRSEVTAKGRVGDYAKFVVHTNSKGVVSLQNKKLPQYWLAIKSGVIKGNGSGGPYCQFNVIDHGHGFISLESIQARCHYVGFTHAGDCKSHINAGISDDEKFYVLPVQPAGGQVIPPSSVLLTDGAKIRLWSYSHGMNVRILENGTVDGRGLMGFYALFTVHSRGQGIVALQNVQNPDNWIAIKNRQTVGTGRGGPFTDLRVHDSVNGMVCFESVKHPGQHLGILNDGSLKSAYITGQGDNGRFHIIVDIPGTGSSSTSSYAGHPSAPQPTPQWGYPSAPQGGVPPPATYPQSTTTPTTAPPFHVPPPAHMQLPAHVPQPMPMSSPNIPGVPVGFNVMDAFQHGNVVQLLVRSNGYPLRVCNKELMAFGDFTPECDFKVHVVPSQSVTQIVIVKLQSVKTPSSYLAIRGGNVHGKGRGGPFCDFKVGVLPDNYVILESVSQPGNYVNMTARGVPSLSNAVLPTSQDAQFFVRLTKQFYAPRAPLMTPIGMPSLFAKLRNDMIIQLEAFHTGVFLSAMPNAVVSATSNPMDPNTLLKVIDRGMGIISLAMVSQPSFMLKESNCSFVAQNCNDLSVDLRFYENSDGSVVLESVTSPSCHLLVNTSNRLSITSVVTLPGTYAIQTSTPLN